MSQSQILLLLSAAFLLAGTVLCATMTRLLRKSRHLHRNGVRTEGVVTRLQATRMGTPGGNTSSVVYYPIVAWATAEGRRMETRSPIVRPHHANPAPGTSLTVLYDPNNPAHATLPSTDTRVYWVFVGVGALFILLGAGFLVGVGVGVG
ncbi:DUF3592 domain-containing protein [Streptomyces sp. NPDC048172]|uniref:DUF3592 domain-containing protein n=1 Tax=Streptomyces sp. NPDC048172 TaxID=3365505 RepID=UPI003718E22C